MGRGGLCMSILLWITGFREYQEACRCHSTPGARKCGANIVLLQKRVIPAHGTCRSGGVRVRVMQSSSIGKGVCSLLWRSVCVCETGADVTCRVTHPDTTAVRQTGERAGRGLCVCAL